MSDKVGVTIRIAGNEASRLSEVVDDLRSQGLSEVESHARFMIVNGNIDSDALDSLRSVKGVESVREDRVYKTQSH